MAWGAVACVIICVVVAIIIFIFVLYLLSNRPPPFSPPPVDGGTSNEAPPSTTSPLSTTTSAIDTGPRPPQMLADNSLLKSAEYVDVYGSSLSDPCIKSIDADGDWGSPRSPNVAPAADNSRGSNFGFDGSTVSSFNDMASDRSGSSPLTRLQRDFGSNDRGVFSFDSSKSGGRNSSPACGRSKAPSIDQDIFAFDSSKSRGQSPRNVKTSCAAPRNVERQTREGYVLDDTDASVGIPNARNHNNMDDRGDIRRSPRFHNRAGNGFYAESESTLSDDPDTDDLSDPETAFDFSSRESSDEEEEESLGTPYQMVGDDYYCRLGKQRQDGDKGVIDVCSYSTAVLFLLQNGDIQKEIDNRRIRIRNNIQAERLDVFNGRLYALSRGTLHELDNGTFDKDKWRWTECSWSPVGITQMSATQDTLYLGVKIGDKWQLYNKDLKVVKKDTIGNNIRIMGRSCNDYIDLDRQRCKAKIFPKGDVFDNVYAATLTHDGKLKSITKEDSVKFRNVRLVNWKPYYIGK